MSSNSLPEDIDLNNIRIKNDKNNNKKKLIKILKERLDEISETLFCLEDETEEKKLLLKD